MNKRKMVFVGLAFIAVAMVSNLQWSMQDYGLKSISLSKQILAQDSNGFWNIVTGTVSDWYEGLGRYDKDKKFGYVTRMREVTTGSLGDSSSIICNEFLNKCVEGTDIYSCNASWDLKPGSYSGTNPAL